MDTLGLCGRDNGTLPVCHFCSSWSTLSGNFYISNAICIVILVRFFLLFLLIKWGSILLNMFLFLVIFLFLLSFGLSLVYLICSFYRRLISTLIPLPAKLNVDTMSISLIFTHILFILSGSISDAYSFFFYLTFFCASNYLYPILVSVIYSYWINLLSSTLLSDTFCCLFV